MEQHTMRNDEISTRYLHFYFQELFTTVAQPTGPEEPHLRGSVACAYTRESLQCLSFTKFSKTTSCAKQTNSPKNAWQANLTRFRGETVSTESVKLCTTLVRRCCSSLVLSFPDHLLWCSLWNHTDAFGCSPLLLLVKKNFSTAECEGTSTGNQTFCSSLFRCSAAKEDTSWFLLFSFFSRRVVGNVSAAHQ